VEPKKRGKIRLGSVIALILIVCAACLVYLWFSSSVNASIRTQIQPDAERTATWIQVEPRQNAAPSESTGFKKDSL